ncbi:MAG TPA: hypothetical protein VGD66_07490 [Allosphingosinicella sp.]|jgi:hypothetical protein
MRSAFDFTAPPVATRLELRLRTGEGQAWVLRVSSGMERFIGAYPRLPGIDADGALLVFRTAGDE